MHCAHSGDSDSKFTIELDLEALIMRFLEPKYLFWKPSFKPCVTTSLLVTMKDKPIYRTICYQLHPRVLPCRRAHCVQFYYNAESVTP